MCITYQKLDFCPQYLTDSQNKKIKETCGFDKKVPKSGKTKR